MDVYCLYQPVETDWDFESSDGTRWYWLIATSTLLYEWKNMLNEGIQSQSPGVNMRIYRESGNQKTLVWEGTRDDEFQY
jgi:hypothetical protein